jgi:hypothetical protein
VYIYIHIYQEAKLSSLLQSHTNLVNFVEKFRGKHVAFTRLEPPPPLPDKLLSEHLDAAAKVVLQSERARERERGGGREMDERESEGARRERGRERAGGGKGD